ncbi:MAG: tripartite tricarboxylate transporter substrate binding protein [Burkholderiaceae bacterium]|nr:tripartite tricarboxylate transporter substrate binding protein [Burkholderiaceae bacterium]
MGVPIVVVNKPGASATLGPAFIARQKPDGYTIGVVTYSTVAITPNLLEVPYKIKDFDFLGVYGRYRYGLVVGADSPYKSVDDLVNAAKQAKDPIFFAAPSAPNNLVFFELANKTGAKFEQVLYKSGTESVTAAASGAVAAAVQTPPEINPQVDGGKVRMLASVSPNRWSDRPDIPTMKELGYDVEIESWMSLAAPLGTPVNIQKRLSDALAAVVSNPQYQAELNKIGLDPVYMTGAEYQQKALQGYKDMRKQLGAIGQTLAPEIQQ